jgi:hypothetical protein
VDPPGALPAIQTQQFQHEQVCFAYSAAGHFSEPNVAKLRLLKKNAHLLRRNIYYFSIVVVPAVVR